VPPLSVPFNFASGLSKVQHPQTILAICYLCFLASELLAFFLPSILTSPPPPLWFL
jgi:hypothetical protein